MSFHASVGRVGRKGYFVLIGGLKFWKAFRFGKDPKQEWARNSLRQRRAVIDLHVPNRFLFFDFEIGGQP